MTRASWNLGRSQQTHDVKTDKYGCRSSNFTTMPSTRGDARRGSTGILSVYVRNAKYLLAADSNGLSVRARNLTFLSLLNALVFPLFYNGASTLLLFRHFLNSCSQDPYVIASVCGQRQRTHVIRKTLNPQWGARLEFSACNMSDLLSSGLKLEVLDSDTFGKDDPLGTLNMDLQDILTQDTISYEQPLPTKGTLCFTISYMELDGRLISQGTLTVTLLRGSGLAAADSNGKSDPYVKLSLGKSKAKSKTIPKTLDPEWNEKFEFQGACSRFTLADLPSAHDSVFGSDPTTPLTPCRHSQGFYAKVSPPRGLRP